MFWEKKEEEKGLPELPPIKQTLPFERFMKEESPEKETLPPLPEDSSKSSAEPAGFPELPEKFAPSKIKEIEEMPMRKIMPESVKAKTEDVYVKIDRFHSARKALNSARDKLKEIDELMRKIREMKMREEQELASWEEEISIIKSKVEDVTKNIFEKVE